MRHMLVAGFEHHSFISYRLNCEGVLLEYTHDEESEFFKYLEINLSRDTHKHYNALSG